MNRQLDVLFVEPNSQYRVYQQLANRLTAIEIPFWSCLLAESCRSVGFGVAILDCNAERLSNIEAIKRIKEINPRLVVFVLYGSNPNSSTTYMSGAIPLCNELKSVYPQYKTCFVGNHISALPKEVLSYDSVDFVLLNEGVYALRNLLKTDLETDLHLVKGIGYKTGQVIPIHLEKPTDYFVSIDINKDGLNPVMVLNPPEDIVPNSKMDVDLPGMAWDLLPYNKEPFDLYRSHIWHANFIEENRKRCAAIYTSLGCFMQCSFCMINIINRTNNNDDISAADSNIMRFWSKDWVLRQLDILAKQGVNHVRFVDELYLAKPKHYVPIHEEIIKRGYDFSFWVYTRCDTVLEKYLDLLRKGGVTWGAIGIESANQTIRQEITKGTFKDIKITDVVSKVRNSGINVIANYMVGFENESYAEMEQTLNLALSLEADMINIYPTMLLPGSPLHIQAKQEGRKLPDSYEAYSFHSYECQPTRTKYLTSAEVLEFRDMFWNKCMTDVSYLDRVEKKFGLSARQNIEEMTKVKLKRKILE